MLRQMRGIRFLHTINNMSKGDIYIESENGDLKKVKKDNDIGIFGIVIALTVVLVIGILFLNFVLISYPILVLGLCAAFFSKNKVITILPSIICLVIFGYNLTSPPDILIDVIDEYYMTFFWINLALVLLVSFFTLFDVSDYKNSTIVNSLDVKKSRISTLFILAILLIIIKLSTVQMADPSPSDIPPVKTETTLEQLELEKLVVETGGSGSGTPSDDPIAEPRPQTQRVLTQRSNPNTQSTTGESRHNTAPNSNETSSTTQASNNPFGTGGDGGGKGSGSGSGPFGNDRGNDGDGPGGNGSGKGRIRLNDPRVDHIETSINVNVHLKLTVNEDGQVISATSTSKTTTTDQRIINQVISAVKSQVKYNKDPGAGLVSMFLTVKVNAT